MLTTDTRTNAIIDWLTKDLNYDIISIENVSSDASFRRYFRVNHSQGQHIVMDAPPEKENIDSFIRIDLLLQTADINVPKIYHQNLAQGFLLIEDFGDINFLDQLTKENASNLYHSAFKALQALQLDTHLQPNQFPHYDSILLTKELTIFSDWFLNQYLNIQIPLDIEKHYSETLISSALEQPQVCVHRDFHSRNLMFLSDNSPGIIDFQDAVWGPITYDLASLLRDCYIAWPLKTVTDWIGIYYQQLTEKNLINTNLDTFSRWFDLMGLQRHLKAIGIFSRLHLRDNKSSYLNDIPRTLKYIEYVCHKYPELNEFNHFLQDIILPAYNNKK